MQTLIRRAQYAICQVLHGIAVLEALPVDLVAGLVVTHPKFGVAQMHPLWNIAGGRQLSSCQRPMQSTPLPCHCSAANIQHCREIRSLMLDPWLWKKIKSYVSQGQLPENGKKTRGGGGREGAVESGSAGCAAIRMATLLF